MAVYGENLAKSYRRPIFSQINFAVEAGCGLGIYGPNGSGKTTLLDIVSGLTRPDKGSVSLKGRVGYVPQQDGLSERLTVLDNLRFYAALGKLPAKTAKQRINACAATYGLEDFLHKRLNRCSAGMRQKCSIGAAMLNQPAVLLLDEAFAPLDTASRHAIRQVLINVMGSGVALIMVSHDYTDFTDLCSQVLSMPDGLLTTL